MCIRITELQPTASRSSILYAPPSYCKKTRRTFQQVLSDCDTLTPSQRRDLSEILKSLLPTKLTPTGLSEELGAPVNQFPFAKHNIHQDRMQRVETIIARIFPREMDTLRNRGTFEPTSYDLSNFLLEPHSESLHGNSSRSCQKKQFDEAIRIANKIPNPTIRSKALREIVDHLISDSLTRPESLSKAFETARKIPDQNIRVKAFMDFYQPLMILEETQKANEAAQKAKETAAKIQDKPSRAEAFREIKTTLAEKL